MGVQNLSNGIDIDRARYERENRLNPPEFAPGQDLNPVSTSDLFGTMGDGNLFSGGGSVFDNSPQEVNTGGMFDPFGSSFSNQGIGGPMPNQMGMPNNGFNTGNDFGPSANGMLTQNQQQQGGFTYDKAEAMAKSTLGGLKSIFSSFTQITPLFWYKYCGILVWVGFTLATLGVAFSFLKIGNAFQMIIAGVVVGVGSLGTSLLLKDKADCISVEYKTDMVQDAPIPTPEPMVSFEESNTSPIDTFDFPEQDTDISLDIEPTEPEELDIDLDNLVVDEPLIRENPEEVLQNMPEIPQGMYTRKYLYDMFTKLLPNICPNFSTLREISTDDRAFFEMESAVQEAAEVTGCKETIELQRLQENYATIIVTTSRPTGLKLETTADELARIYAYRSSDITTDEGRSRVYAKAEAVGRTCIFTIFTGKTEMISLKDMYKSVEPYILDSKNYLPVVFGIDPMARVIVYDLKKLESIIVAGMPRSGKSWFVQNMITQMSAFVGPKELQFYICDPKGEISDFKSFCLPHVRRFVTSDADIMETLRWLVKVEAPRRKKIIGAGDNLTSSQNIWDFKDRYPDVELSIIYVVIDEVVTLASRMDKDTFSEFRSMLRELISQLPALGIRAILIPHVLKNDIIEKKTSDLVLCRISVCGDPEHVESVTGAKSKDFPFKLTMPGDMGVRMPPVSQSIMYLRAPVLTKTNPENRELFDYMRRVWVKLEPDSVKGSIAQDISNDRDTQGALAQEADNLDDLDIFGTDEDAYSDVTESFIKRMNS